MTAEKKILCAVVVFYIAFSLFNCSILEEDAYIYFRCAENIAGGHGYVFNPGSERIEACSSLTWLLMLVILKLLGCNVLVAARIAGIMIGSVSLVLVYAITRHFIRDLPWVVLPTLLTSTSIPFMMRNQMGLETSLYAAVFLLLTWTFLDEKHLKYWPAACGALIATRPEGMFIAVWLLPALYFHRNRRNAIFSGTLWAVVLIILLLGVRLYYFHDFMTSSFYHKVYPSKYRQGILYLHMFCRDYFIYYFLIPLAYLVFRKENWTPRRNILFCFIAVYLVWILLEGADYFPFYRQLVPVIPLVYIYMITGMAGLAGGLKPWPKAAVAVYIAAYGMAALLLPPANWVMAPGPNVIAGNVASFVSNPKQYSTHLLHRLRDPRYDPVQGRDTQIQVGDFIRRNYLPGTTFVYDQMGRLPYQAGPEYAFIDSYGLTEKRIGRTLFYRQCRASRILQLYEQASRWIIAKMFPATEFYFDKEALMDYVFQKDPDIILCFGSIRNMIILGLARDLRFRDNYQLAYSIYGVLFFEKKDLVKKPQQVPEGLPIAYADEVVRQYRDHPLVAALAAGD